MALTTSEQVIGVSEQVIGITSQMIYHRGDEPEQAMHC